MHKAAKYFAEANTPLSGKRNHYIKKQEGASSHKLEPFSVSVMLNGLIVQEVMRHKFEQDSPFVTEVGREWNDIIRGPFQLCR